MKSVTDFKSGVLRFALMLTALLLAATLAEPRAVLIYPAVDGNGAFSYTEQHDIISELESGYDLRTYSDIMTEDELYALPIDGAKLLVLSGHGTPSSIALGGPEDPCLACCDERRYLDMSDAEELKAYFSRLAPDATIFLQSCSTAWGKDSFADLVKRTAGDRTVIASMLPTNAQSIDILSCHPFDAKMYFVAPYHWIESTSKR